MTRKDRRLAIAVATLVLAMLLVAAGMGALSWATLDTAERAAVGGVLQSRIALALMALITIAAVAAFTLRHLFERYVAAPGRLLVQLEVLTSCDLEGELEANGSAETRGLARAISKLLQQRAQLRDDMARRVVDASHATERERNRLAALMAELTQSVVVCNLEGRILLYNARARLQFRSPSGASAPSGSAGLIGLGRSIYAVIDQRIVEHAGEKIQLRLLHRAADPATQFVTTTRTGQLLRVQMAPVLDPAGASTEAARLDGFVLMLDNITQAFQQDSLRDQLLHRLTEGSRSSLANLQAAVEMLEFPDLDPAMRERFHRVIREEVAALSERVRALAADTARQLKTRWPLDDMLGGELVAAGKRQIESAAGLQVELEEVDGDLWLRVDSFSLLQALAHLAGCLQAEGGIEAVRLRLQRAGRRAQLDLLWSGKSLTSEVVAAWQDIAMRIGGDSLPLTVDDVVERHGGEFWYERGGEEDFFRFLLPLAEERDEADPPPLAAPESRPEFYDFDLFQTSPQARELDDLDLSELSYTVFDTETTGLDPAGGDEIIQIGATRIVNGKLLRGECFEQLINPRRAISPASSQIHGIRPEMLRSQPTVAEVLPAFHAFAADTVLVAHNAAFDMRFLQLKEASTGVRFEQPVLDTLLLSAVVHPNADSHSLEAIAQRLDVSVTRRHTALGDALMTAEVFLRLVSLLEDRGVRTLGQARAVAQQTYYARIRY